MAQFKCSIMGPMPCALLPQWLRYQKAWTDLILCKILLLHQMLFQYWRNYNNWFLLPVKRVDVKLQEMCACICYLSENFTRCDVWRRFKAVRQRMTSCTRLQGHVCIIILLFLLQRSVSLKAFISDIILKNFIWQSHACALETGHLLSPSFLVLSNGFVFSSFISISIANAIKT